MGFRPLPGTSASAALLSLVGRGWRLLWWLVEGVGPECGLLGSFPVPTPTGELATPGLRDGAWRPAPAVPGKADTGRLSQGRWRTESALRRRCLLSSSDSSRCRAKRCFPSGGCGRTCSRSFIGKQEVDRESRVGSSLAPTLSSAPVSAPRNSALSVCLSRCSHPLGRGLPVGHTQPLPISVPP